MIISPVFDSDATVVTAVNPGLTPDSQVSIDKYKPGDSQKVRQSDSRLKSL